MPDGGMATQVSKMTEVAPRTYRPGNYLADFDAHWSDPNGRELILGAARSVEAEATLVGLSPHLVAVARR